MPEACDAGHVRAVPRGQQPKPVAQSIGDSRRAQHTEASCRQLESERQAIQTAAHVGDRQHFIRLIGRSAPPCQGCPIDEQPDGIGDMPVVGHLGEVDPHDSIASRNSPAPLPRQARFAATAHPRQRDQPPQRKRGVDPRQLSPSADEARGPAAPDALSPSTSPA